MGPHTLNRIWLAGCASLAGVLLCAGEAAPAPAPGQGVLRQVWTGVGGTTLAELAALEDYPGYPTASEVIPNFETPTDCGDNYGTLVRGYIHPPATGEYTFWIASDDNSELWLSTGEDPKEKRKIAQVSAWTPPRAWDQSPEQKSLPIALTAGRKYYIEAVQKEGGGGDNLSVGWALPHGVQERPIPGSRLTPFPAPKPGPRVPKPPPPPPSAHGHYKLKFEALAGNDRIAMPYLLYLPKNYAKTQEKFPVLFFLHGAGEVGTDLEAVYGWGPSGYLRNNPKVQDDFPLVVVSPQCIPGRRWDTPGQISAVCQLLDHLLIHYRFDPDRIYASGLSMGGKGSWLFGFEASTRLAAIAPLSSMDVLPEKALERLGDLSIWIIVGGADGGFTEGSRRMNEALKASKREVRFTEIPNLGHGGWERYYTNPEFYQWFLKHSRQGAVRPSNTNSSLARAKPGVHSPTPTDSAAGSPPRNPKTDSEPIPIALEDAPADRKAQPAKPTAKPRPKMPSAKRPASKPAPPKKAVGPASAKPASPATPTAKGSAGKAQEAAKTGTLQGQKPPDATPQEPAPDPREGLEQDSAEEPGLAEPSALEKPLLALLWPDSGPSRCYSLSLAAAGILLAAAFVFILQTSRGGKG